MWRRFKLLVGLLILLPVAMPRAEMVDTYQFQSPETRARAVNLAKSLRCPQCQNQNLVESNSPIAYDLRIEVYKMADAGASDQQIVEQMTARFGDFVRYDPPFKTTTWLLWGAPFLLLLLALGLVWEQVRRHKSHPQYEPLTTSPLTAENTQSHQVQSPQHDKQRSHHGFAALLVLLIVAASVAIYALSPRYSALQQGLAIAPQVIQSGAEQRREHRQELQNALSADYNNGENWYQLGLIYLQEEEYANALESFSRAEYLSGANSELLAAAATALYYQSNNNLSEKAKHWLDLSLQQNSNQLRALSLLAADAFAKGDYPQAKQYWQRLLDSDHPDLDRRNLIQNLQAAEMLGGLQQ
ncbi:heme lyase NrfEFG subunit NrfF [Testudinibacter sp. P27/CKL/0425]